MSDEQDGLLTETIARHFPGARVDKNEVDLGLGGLSIACRVNGVGAFGSFKTASLFFQLRGGALGKASVFASMSGYGDSDRDAILTGGCNWACSFGPVLRAGLAGDTETNVERFEVTVDGQAYHLFVDGLDRSFWSSGGDHTGERTRVARARLGGWPWLSRVILDSGRLPLLPVTRSTILSVFVASRSGGLTVEVKINGVDWPGMAAAFSGTSHEPPGAVTLLRELAVLVPTGPPAPLARDAVVRTLASLKRANEGSSRVALGWRGWRQHGGHLGATLSADQVAQLEADVGPLPPDHREFLVTISGAGAGPGYGLLPPVGEAQRRLSEGTFSFEDGGSPDGGPQGVLALAHAGCGIMWYLVLRGPHAGEVWCDARSSDGKVRRVARSFTEWYREWLAAVIEERGPWTAWDWKSCATASVVAQLLEKLKKEQPDEPLDAGRLAGMVGPGKLKLRSGGSRCFDPGAPLDPCSGCVHGATHWGLDEDVFPQGVSPLGRRDEDPVPVVPKQTRARHVVDWLRRLKNGPS